MPSPNDVVRGRHVSFIRCVSAMKGHLHESGCKEGPAPLCLHVLLGSDFRTMAYNQVRNLEEDRLVLIESVVKRPSSLTTDNWLLITGY